MSSITGTVASRNYLVLVSVIMLLVLLFVAVFAPFLHTMDPTFVDPVRRLAAPSSEHWFGTDALGRDLYSRVIYGARVSLIAGTSVVVISVVIGIILGSVTTFSMIGDAIVMRFMDALMAIPGILLAIALVSLSGASLLTVIIAISIPQIPRIARVVRSVILGVQNEPYIEAARGGGSSTFKILIRHMLPNTIPVLIVQGTYIFASAVLTEAILSFLGAGVSPETPSWGNIVADGRVYFELMPSLVLYPGLFLSITVLSINVLGDYARDRLDPRLAER